MAHTVVLLVDGEPYGTVRGDLAMFTNKNDISQL